jgi:hypothetical protein
MIAVANEEHVRRLKQGVADWNAWLEETDVHPDLSRIDLSGADLTHAVLNQANLQSANLSNAVLIGANLAGANLDGTDLSGANLHGANLVFANLNNTEMTRANLSNADLTGATLSEAELIEANLVGADLHTAILLRMALLDANLSRARLSDTVFANIDLSCVTGLDECDHWGPSSLDYLTLERSKSLPLSFLRGVGLPDRLIDYLPSILKQAIQYYSCFISHSSKDKDFADRIYADLQNNGVRCWFAPHDLPIGAKTWDAIDEAIKLRDKLLLILSNDSIESDWVEDEVQKAFAEERERKHPILFPLRIDDAVRDTPEPWARKLWDQRHIGDFRQWKDHDAYKRSFERVLRDLKRAAE